MTIKEEIQIEEYKRTFAEAYKQGFIDAMSICKTEPLMEYKKWETKPTTDKPTENTTCIGVAIALVEYEPQTSGTPYKIDTSSVCKDEPQTEYERIRAKEHVVAESIADMGKDEPQICYTCKYYNSNIPCGSTPSACKKADKFAEEFIDGLKKLKQQAEKPCDNCQEFDCYGCKYKQTERRE